MKDDEKREKYTNDAVYVNNNDNLYGKSETNEQTNKRLSEKKGNFPGRVLPYRRIKFYDVIEKI